METKRRRVLAAAGALGAALALGFGYWSTKDGRNGILARAGESARHEERRAHAHGEESRSVVPSTKIAETVAMGKSAPDEDGQDFETRVRQADKYREKALLSADENAALHELYKDIASIRHAKQGLLEQPASLSPENLEARMSKVLFLAEAMRWKENPIRADVVDAIQEVISSQTYVNVRDPALRKSLAADRFELYLALASELPEDAKRILEASKSTPNAKLIAYADSVANKL